MKIEDAIKRLAFVKYLYNLSVEQSMKPQPACSAAVLMFHDSIELFLELASEHLDQGKSGVGFMEYWELLAPKLQDDGLTQKESVRQLNTARVGLKHSGILPSKSIIEGFRATTTNFFEENTPILFGKKFSDISLIELVQYPHTKKNLLETQELLKEAKIEDALDKVALSFAQLIDDYENRKRDELGRSPFFFGRSLTFLSSFHMDIKGRLGDFVDSIGESVEALREGVKILSLGLDYRRYVKFRLLTPHIERFIGGKYNVVRVDRGQKGKPTTEDVQFCIDFVIESATALQEFDFEIKPRVQPSLADVWGS